ncbi:hypothetical protein E8E11_005723 [Didymella keratinophila]|nr:hypothetical protein E8E11_005723 [Didymella keratinophila]
MKQTGQEDCSCQCLPSIRSYVLNYVCRLIDVDPSRGVKRRPMIWIDGNFDFQDVEFVSIDGVKILRDVSYPVNSLFEKMCWAEDWCEALKELKAQAPVAVYNCDTLFDLAYSLAFTCL